MANKDFDANTSDGTASGQGRFEDELASLETIVTNIDSGELSLEEAISAFEHGVGLVRSLNRRLDDAERRVELLMRGAAGGLRSAPLDLAGIEEPSAPEDSPPRTPKEDDDIPF